MLQKDVLISATTTLGGQCVMIPGNLLKLKLFVDNWDYQAQVQNCLFPVLA